MNKVKKIPQDFVIRLCRRNDQVQVGQKYGMLTVSGQPFFSAVKRGSRKQPIQSLTYAVCRCACGQGVIVATSSLKSGNTVSCGCYAIEVRRGNNRTHGLSGGTTRRLYNVWKSMRSRCYDKRCASYKNYGGRGIAMCNEWLESVTVFCKWATANGYTDDLVCDRIDPDGNYEPGNCQFITNRQNVVKQREDVKNKISRLEESNLRLMARIESLELQLSRQAEHYE